MMQGPVAYRESGERLHMIRPVGNKDDAGAGNDDSSRAVNVLTEAIYDILEGFGFRRPRVNQPKPKCLFGKAATSLSISVVFEGNADLRPLFPQPPDFGMPYCIFVGAKARF